MTSKSNIPTHQVYTFLINTRNFFTQIKINHEVLEHPYVVDRFAAIVLLHL